MCSLSEDREKDWKRKKYWGNRGLRFFQIFLKILIKGSSIKPSRIKKTKPRCTILKFLKKNRERERILRTIQQRKNSLSKYWTEAHYIHIGKKNELLHSTVTTHNN